MSQTLPEEIYIESVGPAYAEVLEALHALAFHRPGDETWTARSFSDVLNSPGSFCLIARPTEPEGAEPCGFSACRVRSGSAELLSLGVSPRHQRLGIAQELISASMHQCHSLGATEMFLEVAKDNPNAQQLYGALGFEAVGERKGYYRRLDDKRVDAITMRILLGDVLD